MKKEETIVLSQTDYQKLSSLVEMTRSQVAELLEEELARVSVVEDNKLPTDVVAMNTKVSFQDLETGKESIVTLVYPHEADINENKVSVLTPVGSALIGLKVGQVIRWPFPNGKQKELKVMSVSHQAV